MYFSKEFQTTEKDEYAILQARDANNYANSCFVLLRPGGLAASETHLYEEIEAYLSGATNPKKVRSRLLVF
jgi:hypothetical protein